MNGETVSAKQAKLEAMLRELSPESLKRVLYLAEGLLASQGTPEGEEIRGILTFAFADKERVHSLIEAEDSGMEKGQDYLACLREWYQVVTQAVPS